MINYQKRIDVKYQVDIVVAGGGPSGIAAAVSAARQGRKVLLIESMGAFGGLGTLGRVPMFCEFSDGKNFLAEGIGREVFDRCIKNGAVSPDDYTDYVDKQYSISINAEKLKRIYDDMVVDSNVSILFSTKVVDAITKDGAVKYIICNGKSSFFAIKADIYIDCTGDGDLAYYAGAEYEKGDEKGNVQAATLCSVWCDINWDEVKEHGFHSLWPNNAGLLEQAFEDGVFEGLDRHLPGMWRTGESTGGGNIGHVFGVNGTDEQSITAAFIQGRKILESYEVYYKKYLKGFENMQLVGTASLMGIRESRRIMGDYVLCAKDFFNRAVFDDEIGRYCYAIDSHAAANDEESFKEFSDLFNKSYDVGESYGIPYRCLTPKGLDNLLVAGRCISTDRNMQASVRVMPGCFITGQAAGMAAAICCENKSGTRDVKADVLRSRLKKNRCLSN